MPRKVFGRVHKPLHTAFVGRNWPYELKAWGRANPAKGRDLLTFDGREARQNHTWEVRTRQGLSVDRFIDPVTDADPEAGARLVADACIHPNTYFRPHKYLIARDRRAAEMLCEGYKPQDVMELLDMSQGEYNSTRKRLRRGWLLSQADPTTTGKENGAGE